MKKFLIASTIAAALTGAALASSAQPFAFTEADTSIFVPVGGSVTTDVRIDASRLFDAGQLIRLEYGALDLSSALRVKQVIAPEGITVNFEYKSLQMPTAQEQMLSNASFNDRKVVLEVEVEKDGYVSGAVPVQLVLENTATGQTVTVNMLVQSQL